MARKRIDELMIGDKTEEKIAPPKIKSLKEELARKPASEEAPQEEIQAEPPIEEQALQQPQEPQQESQTMGNFKQALTYLGPRLIAQLLGGDEAAARTDSLLKGVQQFDESQQKLDLAKRKAAREEQPQEMTPYQREYLDNMRAQTDLKKKGEQRRDKTLDFQREKFGFQVTDNFKKKRKNIIDTFNKDKIVLESRTALSNIGAVRKLITSGSLLAEPAAKRALAKLSGEVGRLTEEDVNAFADPQIVAKIKNIFLRGAGAKGMSEHTKQVFLSTIAAMEKKRKEEIRKVATKQSAQYEAANLFNYDDALSIMTAEGKDNTISQEPQQKQTTDGKIKAIFDQYK